MRQTTGPGWNLPRGPNGGARGTLRPANDGGAHSGLSTMTNPRAGGSRPVAHFATALVLLLTLIALPACAQQMTRVLERGPVGFLHGTTLLQRTGNLTAGDFAHPAVADWDGDGHFDLVCGSGYGDLLLFQRTGDRPFGTARALLPAGNAALAARPRREQVSPWLGHLQPGGDLRLLLGMGDSVYRYAVRGGTTEDGTQIVGPGTAVTLPGPLAPCCGGASVMVVDGMGRVHRIADGTARPAIVAGAQLQVAPPARAWAGDWDGDSVADLVMGTGEGRVLLFGGRQDGTFAAPEVLLAEDEARGHEAAPWATDWDRDGDLDLLVGWRSGTVSLLTRGGDGLRAMGMLQQRDAPIDAGRCAVATTGDWNGDGLQDVVVGGEDGRVTLHTRLSGDRLRFAKGLRISGTDGRVQAPGTGARLYAAPALTDWDADGDLDLLVGGKSGGVLWWGNQRGLRAMGPLQVSGADLRVTGIAMPAPFDYNGDGDMDLFIGARPRPDRTPEPGVMLPEIPPGCAYFENTVDRTGALPVFSKGVPIAMNLISEEGGLRRDAGFLGPYATWPVQWDTTLDFITVSLQGTFRFGNEARRGAYACLAATTHGRGLPDALLPPLYSATPARIDGEAGLLAADVAYGFVTWYEREQLED